MQADTHKQGNRDVCTAYPNKAVSGSVLIEFKRDLRDHHQFSPTKSEVF